MDRRSGAERAVAPDGEVGLNALALSAAELRDEDVVTAFGEVVRSRLGLGRLAARKDALSRRLKEALQAAGYPPEDAPEFVLRARAAKEGDPLLTALADVVPNHETSFFRDADHLTRALATLVPGRVRQLAAGEPLRVLSAGCATGEEVYSLVMLLLDSLHLTPGRPVEVVGVDVSPASVAHARAGVYSVHQLQRAGPGPAHWQRRFFRPADERIVVRDLVRAHASFEVANLVQPHSFDGLGKFDLVVCRNVLIYFDPANVRAAMASMAGCLKRGAALLLAPAESGHLGDELALPRSSGGLSWFEPREVRR